MWRNDARRAVGELSILDADAFDELVLDRTSDR